MRIQRQLFESRVARRVFGSFIVASLLPLLAFSWLATSRVGAALERQAFERLENLSRNYGQATLDKLVSVAEALGEGNALEHASRDVAGLDAISVLAPDGERVVRGEWPGSRSEIPVAADKPTLTVRAGGEIVIAQRLGPGAVFGRVAPALLDRSNGLLNVSGEACLFRAADLSQPFYCSAPPQPAALAALASHAHGAPVAERLTWQSDGEEWLAADWELFLPSRFTAEPWVVVVSEPRSDALGAVVFLERAIPPIAVVTLAFIILLATWQIRRTLNPLNALLAGTERIAAHEFKQPVQVDLKDEFGTLGTALNRMAQQLDHQFTALRALGELDRLILDSSTLEPVLEMLFARLGELIPASRCCALIVDENEPHRGRLYVSQPNGGTTMERTTIGDDAHRWLAEHPPSGVTSLAELQSLGVGVDAGAPTGSCAVAPMASGTLATGALICAKLDGSPLSAAELASLRELATRVAVAVAASKREAELFRRAHYDALTELPNRELLHDRLHQAVAQGQRDEHSVAVLFIDLDGFKAVNDTHGHPVGDELLQETALRLSRSLRPGDTVARLGGDEYAILLPNVHGPLEAEDVAIKAVEALRRPFDAGGHQLFVSASVGIALFPEDGTTATELLRKADMAMYNAKYAGKGCYRFFAEDMDRRTQERHSLHNDLRSALEAGQLSIAYHPQRAMSNGRYTAVEALLRWQHPQRGAVSPAVFVPILEETGLIASVGAWVVRQAIADFSDWRRAGLPLERVAVNVAARQLLDDTFVDSVAEALRETGLEGQHLEVELTEASLVTDFHTANTALTRLRALGIRIALDDFGTGYSSLAYLNELVFDVLKIDRAFVVNLPAPKATAIVTAIIAVAEALGKEVVAEGIETESQWSQLVAMGCDYGQGFLLSKPLPGDALVAFLCKQETSVHPAVPGVASAAN